MDDIESILKGFLTVRSPYQMTQTDDFSAGLLLCNDCEDAPHCCIHPMQTLAAK